MLDRRSLFEKSDAKTFKNQSSCVTEPNEKTQPTVAFFVVVRTWSGFATLQTGTFVGKPVEGDFFAVDLPLGGGGVVFPIKGLGDIGLLRGNGVKLPHI